MLMDGGSDEIEPRLDLVQETEQGALLCMQISPRSESQLVTQQQ